MPHVKPMNIAAYEVLDAAISAQEVEAELEALAKRHKAAGSLAMTLLNQVGGQAEDLFAVLPESVRDGLENQTERALMLAFDVAFQSRSAVNDGPDWITKVLATAMGAAGGMGGLPSALAELPLTTTVLLRAIQSIAMQHGFDVREEAVKYDCVQVLAAAGPLEADDGAELAFFSTRVLVNGAAVSALIARVAPRLGLVLGQKLAAQTVPVLGAAAGAATNYAYTGYYQDMAHVQFGLRRLAIRSDIDAAELAGRLREKLTRPKYNKG